MDRLEGLGYSTILNSKFDRGLIKLFSFFTEGTKDVTAGKFRCDLCDGGDRVKVSKNLGATSVAPVVPVVTMAIRVVEFSNGGYKIRKIFA